MKMHRYLTALCLAAPMCLAETADVDADYEEDYGEDYEEVADRTYTEAEKAAAVQQFAELLGRMNATLRGVKDRAAADAAAPVYLELEKQLEAEELRRPLMEAGPSGIIEIVQESRKVHKELGEVFFYGSAALAEAVTGDATEAQRPQPLTPEVQAALLENEEEDEGIIVHLGEEGGDSELSVSGGPGFSRETAWVSSASNRSMVSFHVAMIMHRKYQGVSSLSDVEEKVVDGKVYSVMTVDFVKDGTRYRGEVWVDVSAGCKSYTPEQQQAALEKVCAYVREGEELLKGVKDKASADAAADRLLEMKKGLSQEDLDIISSMDSDKVREAMEAVTPSEEERAALLKRLMENDFYGSEKLKKIN